MENFFGPWTRDELVDSDTFAYPTPNTVEMQWIATEDVGTFATYAFAHPELAPLNLKLSGPERLNGEGVAERFSRALGREIGFRAMPAEEFGRKLDAVFPGMGEGAAQGYAAAYEHPERFSTNVDLDAALKEDARRDHTSRGVGTRPRGDVPVKLAIFGATGRTGKPLVTQALEQGHEVRALARDPAKLDVAQENLLVIHGATL